MKVSIIIPNWNGRALLEKNLPSVFAAKKNLDNSIAEIIIVDDASTDDTEQILKQITDKRFRYFSHKKNQHVSASRNTGIATASCELIGRSQRWLPK